MIVTLKSRLDEPIIYQDALFTDPVPDIILRDGVYYVRAGISDGRATFLTATVVVLEAGKPEAAA